MKIENLKVGMVVKNYPEMCELLEVDVKGGKSKKLQLVDWERYFKSHKQGQKFIIDEIYETPIEKVNNRGKTYKKENLMLDKSPELYDLVIDKIDNLTVYNKSESVRYKCVNCEDIDLDTPFTIYNTNGKCKSCRMSTFARKIYKVLLKSDVEVVTEYVFEDLRSSSNHPLRFDFALFKDRNLIGLIEYDGEYHDDSEIIIKHDELKNNYCEVNNVPLLRIHHTEKSIMYSKLKCYFDTLQLESTIINKYLIRELLMDKDTFNKFLNCEDIFTLNDILKLK